MRPRTQHTPSYADAHNANVSNNWVEMIFFILMRCQLATSHERTAHAHTTRHTIRIWAIVLRLSCTRVRGIDSLYLIFGVAPVSGMRAPCEVQHWCALMPIIAVAQIHACTSHIRLTCILSLASHARALHSIVEYKIPNRHIIHRLARVVRSEVCVCVCFVDATVQHGCNYAIHRQHAISAPVHAVNVLCKQTLIVICFSYRIF